MKCFRNRLMIDLAINVVAFMPGSDWAESFDGLPDFRERHKKRWQKSHLVFFSREDRIRTCDPLVPNQVFYRAELPPEYLCSIYCILSRLHFVPSGP